MSIGKSIIRIYYVDKDENIKYLSKYKKSLCIKVEDKAFCHNRLRLILFLIRAMDIYRNDFLMNYWNVYQITLLI